MHAVPSPHEHAVETADETPGAGLSRRIALMTAAALVADPVVKARFRAEQAKEDAGKAEVQAEACHGPHGAPVAAVGLRRLCRGWHRHRRHRNGVVAGSPACSCATGRYPRLLQTCDDRGAPAAHDRHRLLPEPLERPSRSGTRFERRSCRPGSAGPRERVPRESVMGNALISFLLICVSCAAPVALAAFAWRQLGSPYSAPSMRSSRATRSRPARPVPASQAAPHAPAPRRRRRTWAAGLGRAAHRAASLHPSS